MASFDEISLGLGCGPLGGLYGTMNQELATQIVNYALNQNIKLLDTSPYYNDSELVLGQSLEQLKHVHRRDSYILATKVGRYGTDRFDYSTEKVRSSIQESCKRLHTSYLDIVYCHDVEFVSLEEVVHQALPELFRLKELGFIRRVGISGYPLAKLLEICKICFQRNQPLDVILSYCHLTLQNDQLVSEGYVQSFKRFGVQKVYNASPFAMGLLSDFGPQPWHPAPQPLKGLANQCIQTCQASQFNLSKLAMTYALELGINTLDGTILGCTHVHQIDQAIACYQWVQTHLIKMDHSDQVAKDSLVEYTNWKAKVATILQPYHNFCWQSPYEGFQRK